MPSRKSNPPQHISSGYLLVAFLEWSLFLWIHKVTALRVYVEQRQCSALETLVQCFLRAMEKWCVTRGAELPRALPCRAASPVTMSTKTCRPPKFKHTLEEVVTSQRRAAHSPSTLFQSLSLSQHRLGMLLQNLPVLVFPSPVCVQF